MLSADEAGVYSKEDEAFGHLERPPQWAQPERVSVFFWTIHKSDALHNNTSFFCTDDDIILGLFLLNIISMFSILFALSANHLVNFIYKNIHRKQLNCSAVAPAM